MLLRLSKEFKKLLKADYGRIHSTHCMLNIQNSHHSMRWRGNLFSHFHYNKVSNTGTKIPIFLIRKRQKENSLKSLYYVCGYCIPTEFMHFKVLNAWMSFMKVQNLSRENKDLGKDSFKFPKRFVCRLETGKLFFPPEPNGYRNWIFTLSLIIITKLSLRLLFPFISLPFH